MIKALKTTALISFLTFISRLLGLMRDVLIAICFGVSSQSDAFFIAFRPFDLVRKLFSEGILNISFIPVFTKTLVNVGRAKAVSLFFSFFCFLTFAGTIIVLFSIVSAPLIVKMIAPGFIEFPYKLQLTTVLFKIMLPYLWIILISSICMGVLNAFGNFAVPALTPVIFNLVIIVFTVTVSNYFDIPVTGLALGVTAGGIIQLAVQIPYIIRLGIFNISLFAFFHPGVAKIIKIMIPSMIGAAAYQINIMTASFFASKLEEGSVSFLYYADRLVQFPLALFAVSTAMVLLPQLSEQAARKQIDEIADLFSSAVNLVFFITIPAMAGLMALDEQIVSLLFGYGVFEPSAVHQTKACLFFLSMGLWAFTGGRLFVTLYYSLSNIKVPFYSGIITIGLNLIFCFLFMHSLGLNGVVLSVSLSASIGFIILLIYLPGAIKINKNKIIVSACRSLFLSVIMFFIVQQAAGFIPLKSDDPFWFGAGVLICICFGVLFYFSVNYLISSPELKILRKGFKKQ